MEYYLETNSLRQIVPYLEHEVLENKCYTSILSLIEIASGIKDESSFILRSTIIRKVLESKLAICIILPETLHLKAFGFPINDKDITSGIKRILDKIIASESYKSFQDTLQKSSDTEYFDFIYDYDEKAATTFHHFFDLNINEARKSPGFKELKKNYNTRWNSTDPNVASEFYYTLLDYFAEALHKRQHEIGDFKMKLGEIKESYDHSLDTFFIMAAYYADSHISFGSQVGKNDYFDLSHLMYLPNTTTKIITDDKLFHKLMINSFSNNIYTTERFKKLNGI